MLFRYCYLIALGTNKGDLSANLNVGIQALVGLGSFCFFSTRQIVSAVLPPGELNRIAPDYLNQVAMFLSNLDPDFLYDEIRKIEDILGHPRDTGQLWPDRHLDVDLLLMWQQGGVVDESIISESEAGECDYLTSILNQRGWLLTKHESSKVTIPHKEFKNRIFLQKMFAEVLNESQKSIYI